VVLCSSTTILFVVQNRIPQQLRLTQPGQILFWNYYFLDVRNYMETTFITFCVVLLSSILSGMSGGGGGFIMTPYFLLVGLTPQQNIAVGSVIGLGLSGGSLVAARRTSLLNRRIVYPLTLVTVAATIIATFVLPNVHAGAYEKFIGVFLLVMIPTLFIKKGLFLPGARSKHMMIIGYGLFTLLWFANAIFSAGFAALLFVPMLFCMGMTALEANVTKRIAALVQAVVLFAVLAPQGLIVWSFAAAGLVGAWIGGHIGTHIAIKNGEQFARYALAGLMVVSSILLLCK